MGKLPFVVSPRLKPRTEVLGTEYSGQIEIERKGFLTVGEKAFVANGTGDTQALALVVKLSNRVAKKYKIDQQEAYQAVVDAVTSPSDCSYPVLDDYGAEITELASVMMAEEQKKSFVKAYCLLVYRVSDEIEMDEVLSMHEELVEALVELYHDEENKSIERLVEGDDEEAGSEVVEEVEKK